MNQESKHLGRSGLRKPMTSQTKVSGEATALGDCVAPCLWPGVIVAILMTAAIFAAERLWPGCSFFKNLCLFFNDS